MWVTFLGTGAGAPTLARSSASLALSLEGGEVWLFDCGEGTQRQLLRTSLKVGRLRRVFVSHLHGDHVYGLLGLLATRDLASDAPLDLYGPPGLREFVQTGLRCSDARLGFTLRFHDLHGGSVADDGRFTVRCLPLRHRLLTFGFRVQERLRPGTLDLARALELGVPAGPLLARLKCGERASLPDGRAVEASEVVGPPRPGRSLAYCVDTAPCDEAVDLAEGVDLLIHEATFRQADAAVAVSSHHSTAAEAAEIARRAAARQLVLTHISARYQSGAREPEAALLAEARAVFPGSALAEDLQSFELRGQPRQLGEPVRT